MRINILIVAIVSVCFLSWTGARIYFQEGDLKAAQERAKEESKNYLVHVYANWSTVCKIMEETSYSDSEVVETIDDNYIPVKLNLSGLEGKLFDLNYSVKTLPAVFIFDENGKLLSRRDKYVKTKELRRLLRRYSH